MQRNAKLMERWRWLETEQPCQKIVPIHSKAIQVRYTGISTYINKIFGCVSCFMFCACFGCRVKLYIRAHTASTHRAPRTPRRSSGSGECGPCAQPLLRFQRLTKPLLMRELYIICPSCAATRLRAAFIGHMAYNTRMFNGIVCCTVILFQSIMAASIRFLIQRGFILGDDKVRGDFRIR